jgi:hypothetical protein
LKTLKIKISYAGFPNSSYILEIIANVEAQHDYKCKRLFRTHPSTGWTHIAPGRSNPDMSLVL